MLPLIFPSLIVTIGILGQMISRSISGGNTLAVGRIILFYADNSFLELIETFLEHRIMKLLMENTFTEFLATVPLI